MSALDDPPPQVDRRVLFCRLLEKPSQECLLRVQHFTKLLVSFEAIVMVIGNDVY